jgi:hypothetical protein
MKVAHFPLLKLPSFLLILTGLLLSACSVPQEPQPSQTSPAEIVTEAAAEVVTEVATQAPTETSTPLATATEPAAVGLDVSAPTPRGETVASADFEYTVLDVVRGEEALARLEDASPFNDAPDDESMEYVIVYMRVRYTGNSAEALDVNPSCIDSSWSGGTQYDKPSILDVRNPEPFLQAHLLPGEQIEGWVTVLARKDDPAPVLVVQPRINGMSTGVADQRYLSLGQ